MMQKNTQPNDDFWQSDLDIAGLFSQPSAPMYPFAHAGRYYFLQALPQQAGRTALMQVAAQSAVCRTPEGFNIRTRVHEYGGCCFCRLDDQILFSRFADGGLYRQPLDGSAAPTVLLDNADRQFVGFADLVATPDKHWLLAVAERRRPGRENENLLVAVSLRAAGAPPVVLASGADFYAGLCISDDQTQVAWFEWDHPCMPWDQSRLMRAQWADEDGGGALRHISAVFDYPDVAVCQPGFMPDNSLVFISEKDSGYWNFFVWQAGTVRQLTADQVEYGEAHWVFGQQRWQPVDQRRLVAVATDRQGDSLVLLDWRVDGAPPVATTLGSGFAACSQLRRLQGGDEAQCLLVAGYPDRAPAVLTVGADTGKLTCIWRTSEAGRGRQGAYRPPEAITFPARDGAAVHAFYYAPRRADRRSPLMVFVHGGPTGRATAELHLLKQYFVSLGCAVLDVNHRGSTGYGRAYRQRLLGQWGELDVNDIADGVRFVVDQGWVEADKVFIRGGSAGGYVVLCALTRYPQQFAAGVSYYGIGNLITLAEVTHKFEARYTERLVGEAFDRRTATLPDSLYRQRSPIFSLSSLRSPLILFQGLDDRVVPPAVSREMAAALEANGLRYAYHEYAGEGHGFRQAQTRIDSLAKETAFLAPLAGARAG